MTTSLFVVNASFSDDAIRVKAFGDGKSESAFADGLQVKEREINFQMYAYLLVIQHDFQIQNYSSAFINTTIAVG